MNRWLRALILIILIVFPMALSLSRDSSGQIDVARVIAQEGTIDPENTPEPTPFPSPTPIIPPDVLILLAVRADLEVLADAQLGVGNRPAGWYGPLNNQDPQIALLTRLDLETLATALINPEDRPSSGIYGPWFGTVASTPYAIARDVRHDLELLAWRYYGETRPPGWTGSDPLLRCDRSTQALEGLLDRGGLYRIEVEANDPKFCTKVSEEVSKLVETQLLSNTEIGRVFTNDIPILSQYEVNTTFAVAFLDSAAQRRVGVIPAGTLVQLRSRSTVEFSKMMVVYGPNFEVYIEYTQTNVPAEIFRSLPSAQTLTESTYCLADWCSAN